MLSSFFSRLPALPVVPSTAHFREVILLGIGLPEIKEGKAVRGTRGENERVENGGRISLGVKVSGEAAAVIDGRTGEILYAKNLRQFYPMASITKLMTALVFLENNPGWDQEVEIKAEYQAKAEGSRLAIPAGEKITARDAFFLMLMASKNDATLALVAATGVSNARFTEFMNQKADTLGYHSMHFQEPTGLSEQNIADAEDILKMFAIAIQKPEIQMATTRAMYSAVTSRGTKIQEESTNSEFLQSYLNDGKIFSVLGGKTGYTVEAGYCLVTGIEEKKGGEKLLAVVLGSKNKQDRVRDIKSLFAWTMRQKFEEAE